MTDSKPGHPIWLGESEDGKFYAISKVTPRFCLQATSMEQAREKAIAALEQYGSATPVRRGLQSKRQIEAFRPIKMENVRFEEHA